MSTEPTTPTPAELAEGATAAAVGGGIITMTVFPLALPLILLTVAAAIPLLVVAAAVGLVAAVVAVPIALLRGLRRAVRSPRRTERREHVPPRVVAALHR